MALKTSSKFVIAGAVTVATVISSTANGQCSVTPPPGSIVSPDGCAHIAGGDPDSNGGCNIAPAVFTDLGSIPTGGSINVAGEFGTYDPLGAGGAATTRDLDWYLVSCDGGTLSVSLSTLNSTGSGQMANSVVFIKANVGADPCVGNFNVGVQSSACPHVQSIVSGAGQHLVVVTTPFETAGSAEIYNCGQYLMTLTHTPLLYPICGTSTESCTDVHATGGCNLPACCDSVCSFNPLCCDVGWDQSCVDSAITTCGLFVYNCAPGTGAPANDCATAAQLITLGQSNVVANNTLASTDGPVSAASACVSKMGKDLWYTIKAPANGALSITTCASGDATTDSVIELYNLGTDPVITATRAQTLPDMYIGCIDDSCADATGTVIVGGPTAVTLLDATADTYYLIRIGGWYDETVGGPETADTFTLTIVTSFEYVVYTTGPQHAVVTIASAALTNLGLSSGCIAATSPQRWLAQPFTAPATGAPWSVSRFTVKGFVPAGVTNETMNYVVWSRAAGNPAPTAANQLFAGSVPFAAAGYDQGGDDAATASRDIPVAFELAAGDYYLTAYASNASCGTIFSNWAWFISAYDGINLIDASGVFNWRSAAFPTPGFLRYSGLNGVYRVQDGADANDLYNTAFDVFGTPGATAPVCEGDFNGDQVRDGLDLTVVLAGWGTPAGDCNDDGTTNGLDLTVILAGWGACPN